MAGDSPAMARDTYTSAAAASTSHAPPHDHEVPLAFQRTDVETSIDLAARSRVYEDLTAYTPMSRPEGPAASRPWRIDTRATRPSATAAAKRPLNPGESDEDWRLSDDSPEEQPAPADQPHVSEHDSDDQPHDMTPAERRISQSRQGSHARLTLSKADEAAHRLIAWLREAHPQWLLAIVHASGIADQTALENELRVTISLFGAKMINNARNGVASYDNFSKRNKNILERGSAYPPTVMILAMYVRETLQISQDKKASKPQVPIDPTKRLPKPYKGTMGDARLKQLAAAHTVFGAPFPPALLDAIRSYS